MDAAAQRRINRQVASQYLPELIALFDETVSQGFTPRLTVMKFKGDALALFNQLVAQHQAAEAQKSRLSDVASP